MTIDSKGDYRATELTHNWSPSWFYDVASLCSPPTHTQSIIATDQLLKSRSDHHKILFPNVPPAPPTNRFCFCVPCNCLGPLCWHICANPWRYLCRHFSLPHRCKVSDMPFLRLSRLWWVELIADRMPQYNNPDYIIYFRIQDVTKGRTTMPALQVSTALLRQQKEHAGNLQKHLSI